MVFGLGRLSWPGGTFVVELVVAVGVGVAGPAGCWALDVRDTVTAVRRGAGVVEVAAGVPVSVVRPGAVEVDAVGAEVGEAASLQTSSPVGAQALVER